MVDAWWIRIVQAYTEQGRHYHTLQHVERMLRMAADHSDLGESRVRISLAIFFHDIVYDPTRKDNEEKSVAVFREYASAAQLSAALAADVDAMIRATIGHTLPKTAFDDMRFFLDLDLEVLSWSEEEYGEYAARIRREYAHVPEAAFRQGRRAVLESFLNRPCLYFTGPLQAAWEPRARANLKREIASLSS